ncbi:MAG: hypothetical protein Q3962_08850 [Corynebacterium sp.]|nr:hypothetical protein [Corynebacterium sp.]
MVKQYKKILTLDNGPEIVRQCARYCFKDTQLMFRIWGKKEARSFLPGVVGDNFNLKTNKFKPEAYRELLNATYEDLEHLMAKEYSLQIDQTPDKNTISSTLIGILRDHAAAQLMNNDEAMFVVDSPYHVARNSPTSPFAFELEVTALRPNKRVVDPSPFFPTYVKEKFVGNTMTYGHSFYTLNMLDTIDAYQRCMNLYDLLADQIEAFSEMIRKWELPRCFLEHLFWTPAGTMGNGPFELRLGMIMAIAEQFWLNGRVPDQRDVDFMYWAILHNIGTCMHPGHLVLSNNLWWIIARCFATIGIHRQVRPNNKPLPSLSRLRAADEKILLKRKTAS